MFLFLIFPLLTLIRGCEGSQNPDCPPPTMIPSSEFPAFSVKGHEKVQLIDGKLICPGQYIIAKMHAKSKTFSTTRKWRCNPLTKQWVTAFSRVYIGPKYMSCGIVSEEAKRSRCEITDERGDGDYDFIYLHPGNEQYCPPGHVMQFKDGTPIKTITCETGANITTGLKIETFNGHVYYPITPGLKCVPLAKNA